MPARISIEFQGIIQGEYLINEDVVRVGGDSECEVRVPSEVGHLVTIRFADGRYTVFNRSGRDVKVESRVLPANGSLEWKAGDDLCLDDGIVLTLIVEGSPEPARRTEGLLQKITVAATDADEPDESEKISDPDQDSDVPGPSSSSAGQIVVIVICGLLLVLILALDSGESPTLGTRDEQTTQRDFADCISKLNAAVKASPATLVELEHLRTVLQNARIQELRPGAERKALDLYGEAMKLATSEQYRNAADGSFRDAGGVASLVFDFSSRQSQEIRAKTGL